MPQDFSKRFSIDHMIFNVGVAPNLMIMKHGGPDVPELWIQNGDILVYDKSMNGTNPDDIVIALIDGKFKVRKLSDTQENTIIVGQITWVISKKI